MLVCNRQRRPCLNHVGWIAVRRQFAHGSVMHLQKRTSVLRTHLSDGQGKGFQGRQTFRALGLRRRHPTPTRQSPELASAAIVSEGRQRGKPMAGPAKPIMPRFLLPSLAPVRVPIAYENRRTECFAVFPP